MEIRNILQSKIKNNVTILILYANVRFLFNILKDLLKAVLRKEFKSSYKQRGKPKVLQLPITNRCNLRCITCNVESITEDDITIKHIKKIVKDKFFSNIISIGINGGEPFLVSDIIEYIKELITLPKLNNISIITNGMLTERILQKLSIIKTLCNKENINLSVTVSIDGYGNIHDNIRKVKGSFNKVVNTYLLINKEKNKYCNNLGVICTVSNQNIFYLKELEAFFQLNNIRNVSYQLAVKHERLYNSSIEEFSVLEDKYTKMLAQEFFYSLFETTKQRKYYFIFKYIEEYSRNNKRRSTCSYSNRDITIDATGNIMYCATKSKILGDINKNNVKEIFLNKRNIKYRKQLLEEECDNCIHYTSNNGLFWANLEYHKMQKNRIVRSYKFK